MNHETVIGNARPAVVGIPHDHEVREAVASTHLYCAAREQH